MKKMKVVRTKVKSFFLTIPVLFCLICPYDSDTDFTISSPYYYSDGNIFFVNSISEIPINHKNDIYVIDERHVDDSNMKVVNSHVILSLKKQREIIMELIKYNETSGDFDWQRTIDSMEYEWLIHNISYYLGILPGRAGDVDFNNNDEKIYALSLHK